MRVEKIEQDAKLVRRITEARVSVRTSLAEMKEWLKERQPRV